MNPAPTAVDQNSLDATSREQTFFSHPPILGRVTAFQRGSGTPSSYEFTLTLPEGDGCL